jgi:tRNA 2-thiouridine synthesizing protein A
MNTQSLDCTGMNCPMPIVEISRAVRKLNSGDLLEVSATDLAFRPDVEAWARRSGHSLEEFVEGPVQLARIRVT